MMCVSIFYTGILSRPKKVTFDMEDLPESMIT